MNDKTIKKAFDIVKQANDTEGDFLDKYSEFLTETGDRSSDYSGYSIPLDEFYYLHISFVDFRLSGFSINKDPD